MRNPELIYDLKPEEFENLVVQLLQAEGYQVSDNFVLSRNIDFIAFKDDRPFGVIVKECIRFFGPAYEAYRKQTKMFVPFVF